MRLIYFWFLSLAVLFFSCSGLTENARDLQREFEDPPREFSLMPFWFWNDTLNDDELIRQIADFEAHGVYGFVIHPRIGLPEDTGWLSPAMIRAKQVAIKEAAKRDMCVILYDEGMYPSGSSAGQVVARNPEHAARGLAKIDLDPGEEPRLAEDMKLVTVIERPGGDRVAIVEKPSGGVIRGLHYINEGTEKVREELPPAADILNPDAVESFIDLVYERFAEEFGEYFGTTIIGIFTDEPEPMGRSHQRGMMEGSADLLKQVNSILGYDFKPYLNNLWYDDHPDSEKYRNDYFRAINICLEENYYKPLSEFCEKHGIALMGHPASSMDIGTLRYFQIPGQDLVWRYVEPGPKALEGGHSTMAKCASSAMIHLERDRNSNELYGAYGHDLTWEEVVWLADWCFVRGQNFLFPHAFYYSVRGIRVDERPPDVGPNSPWWDDDYKSYADACRRLSWLNTDSKHVCETAILGNSTYLPYRAAKACFQNQRDFNYLETRHLWEDAEVANNGVRLAGMHYKAVILDSLIYLQDEAIPALREIERSGRLIVWSSSPHAEEFGNARQVSSSGELIAAIDDLVTTDVSLFPSSQNIRYRHVVKGNNHYYILFNEEDSAVNTRIEVSVTGETWWLDAATGESAKASLDESVSFEPFELKLLMVIKE
ncbi:MAG: hypothetical protein ACLFQA_03455 [Bacteroidales bacterium]